VTGTTEVIAAQPAVAANRCPPVVRPPAVTVCRWPLGAGPIGVRRSRSRPPVQGSTTRPIRLGLPSAPDQNGCRAAGRQGDRLPGHRWRQRHLQERAAGQGANRRAARARGWWVVVRLAVSLAGRRTSGWRQSIPAELRGGLADACQTV
jgi:hypothetical protein